ncbi:MAG: hypothetical protein NTW50_02600 [Candidatus Berkelbacteria bacterium]|nr:hypothetical protein [Candidatus Berkelbacteria bacterium]
MNRETNPKIALLLIEGLGLSTAWQNNALASAKTANFDELWQNCEHEILASPVNNSNQRVFNLKESYSLIAKGEVGHHSKIVFDDLIRTGELQNNPVLQNIFANVSEKHSTLHLIGNLSKGGEFGSLAHLLALVKMAKRSQIYNLKIHLFVDDTYLNKAEIKKNLDDLEMEISKIGLAEIATLCGVGQIEANKSAVLSNLVSGRGQYYISPTQTISQISDLRPSQLPPTTFVKNQSDLIANFDSILFFNHANWPLSALLEQILMIGSGGNLAPNVKYLKIGALFEEPTNYKNIIFAFKIPEKETLTQLLSQKGIKSAIFSDSPDKITLLRQYFGSNEVPEFFPKIGESDSQVSDYFDLTQREIRKQNFDFCLINVAALAVAASSASFNNIVSAVKTLDHSLKEFINKLTDDGYEVLLSSPYGLVEKVTVSSDLEGKPEGCVPTKNSLPFIIVSRPCRSQSKANNLLEMLARDKDLSYVYGFVREVFNV